MYGTVEQHIEFLRARCTPGEHLTAIYWNEEDVASVEPTNDDASPADVPFTQDERRLALAIFDKRHDATIGLTWDTLEDAVREVLQRRPADGQLP